MSRWEGHLCHGTSVIFNEARRRCSCFWCHCILFHYDLSESLQVIGSLYSFHFTCLDIHLLFSLHIYSFPLTLVGGLVFFVHVLAFYLCFAQCVGLSGA